MPNARICESRRLAAYVIPTDEELMIARDTVRCVLKIRRILKATLPHEP
jgi:acetate kinase